MSLLWCSLENTTLYSDGNSFSKVLNQDKFAGLSTQRTPAYFVVAISPLLSKATSFPCYPRLCLWRERRLLFDCSINLIKLLGRKSRVSVNNGATVKQCEQRIKKKKWRAFFRAPTPPHPISFFWFSQALLHHPSSIFLLLLAPYALVSNAPFVRGKKTVASQATLKGLCHAIFSYSVAYTLVLK